MVRDPNTGKYRRTRLFVLTLGYSRKSVRLLTFQSSARIWAELHEQAFRRLGGVTRIVVLDNLREGVLKPDIYDPAVNPLYRDMLAHYGAVGAALPRRCTPDRKGKVESGVGHAKRTPLKGLRFESLAEAQTYLDHWEERWADTRIHGTTKRQVAAMFAEEKPALLPLPLEPFRYYQYGERTVHLDGCVEVAAAYYSAPPGWIGRAVRVQWDEHHVRVLDPLTGQLLREHLRQERGRHRIQDEDRSRKTPQSTTQLLARCEAAGRNIGALCQALHRRDGEIAVRRILGILSLARKHGAATRRCRLCHRAGGQSLRVSLRSPLSRTPASDAADAPPGRSHHPPTHALSRSHRRQNPGEPLMNLIELQRSLRQLRLGGIAAVLETRLHQAQAEPMAPIDFLACLVSDELTRRADRLLERRRKEAGFRDANRDTR